MARMVKPNAQDKRVVGERENMNYKIIVLDFVNAFLVKLKDGFILIDTGMPQHWERLEAQLTAEGCLPSN